MQMLRSMGLHHGVLPESALASISFIGSLDSAAYTRRLWIYNKITKRKEKFSEQATWICCLLEVPNTLPGISKHICWVTCYLPVGRFGFAVAVACGLWFCGFVVLWFCGFVVWVVVWTVDCYEYWSWFWFCVVRFCTCTGEIYCQYDNKEVKVAWTWKLPWN